MVLFVKVQDGLICDWCVNSLLVMTGNRVFTREKQMYEGSETERCILEKNIENGFKIVGIYRYKL